LGAGFSTEAITQVIEQLTEPELFEGKARTNERPAGGLGAENSSGAKGPYYFVVAHVDNPDVSLPWGKVARNVTDDVGIDGGDTGVDDFEIRARIATFKEQREHTCETIGGLRVAHGCGFAQDKDARGIDGLFGREEKGVRRTGEAGREEALCEALVVDKDLPAIDGFADGKTGWIAVADESQHYLKRRQEQQRQ
jgi:hypothetical protein